MAGFWNLQPIYRYLPSYACNGRISLLWAFFQLVTQSSRDRHAILSWNCVISGTRISMPKVQLFSYLKMFKGRYFEVFNEVLYKLLVGWVTQLSTMASKRRYYDHQKSEKRCTFLLSLEAVFSCQIFWNLDQLPNDAKRHKKKLQSTRHSRIFSEGPWLSIRKARGQNEQQLEEYLG